MSKITRVKLSEPNSHIPSERNVIKYIHKYTLHFCIITKNTLLILVHNKATRLNKEDKIYKKDLYAANIQLDRMDLT